MKKTFLNSVLAAVLGSALTILVFWGFGFLGKSVNIQHLNGIPARNAMYTLDDGKLVPLDFTKTASVVMDAVVNITSTITPAKTSTKPKVEQQQIPDPFRDFFGPQFKFFEYPEIQQQPSVGTGSGVIINSDGYIVTNNHVVAGADDIQVTLHDKRVYKATVIGTDPSTDLALIKIKESNLPTLSFVNSDDVKVGEWVLAVGNPYNLESTVTAGIVSAKARNINILKDRSAVESFIQTDAAINPGNSGGALVDLTGGLVGINTAIASPTGSYSGYGFAIPANIVSKVVEDLLKYGLVQRGYLGIVIRSIDGTFAKEKKLSVNEGVYVDSFAKNSAARQAGIKEGDVITQIDGIKVNSSPELQEVVARHRPGDKVSLTVDRNGTTKTIEVVLSNKDGSTDLVSKENAKPTDLLGAEFETLDSKTAKSLEISGGVKVTKLNDGKLQQFTDMREGFIITKIDGKEIKTVEELQTALQGKKGGVMLEGVYEDRPGVFYYAFGL